MTNLTFSGDVAADLHTLPIMSTGGTMCAEGEAVLLAPGCSKVIHSRTCSPHLQVDKLLEIQSQLLKREALAT